MEKSIEEIMVETTSTLMEEARTDGKTLTVVVALLIDSEGVNRVLYSSRETEDVIDFLMDAAEYLEEGESLAMTSIRVDVGVISAQWRAEGGDSFDAEEAEEALDGDMEWDDEDWSDE